MIAIFNFTQIAPFKQFANEEDFENEYFNGTIFRFPLRDQKSELSENVYSREKIESLFDSFKSEAKNILLFLNHVTSISLNTNVCKLKGPYENFKVESKITAGSESKVKLNKTLRSYSEAIKTDEAKQLKLRNESTEASFSLIIKTYSEGIASGKSIF